jgi:heat shock protein HtpX
MLLAAVGVKTQIWNNQIKSVLLLLGFPVLLLLMLYVFFALVAVFQPAYIHYWFQIHEISPAQAGFEGLKRYWLFPIGIAGFWYLFSSFFHQFILDSLTGSKPITRKEDEKLYDLLENLCISRGLTMPMLYIIETDALNAYASGISPTSYAVTVTRGLIDKLNEQELEAVLAHELTHIMNKDVSLMMTGVIFTGLLSIICELLTRRVFRTTRHSSLSNKKDGKNLFVIMLIALAVIFIGKLFSLALQLCLSRKREFMADAGSVELTKNPDALISALLKISKNPEIQNVSSEITQMCIAEPKSNFFDLFSTHPSVEDRVSALVMMGGREPEKLEKSDQQAKSPWK